MNPISMLLWLLPVSAVVFLWSLIASRAGSSVQHTRAFYAGLVGLLAIPAWLVAMAGLAMQLLSATLASPSGVLFVLSSIALLVCFVVAITSLVRLRSRG